MTTPKMPVKVSDKTQDAVSNFYKAAVGLTNNQWQIRGALVAIDKEYMRENDQSAEQRKARIANSYGDKTKMQNFTVPVVLPQTEQAVTYLVDAFLSGTPIFGVVAGKDNMQEALQMDTLMLNHQQHGGWVREFTMFFRDALKYNLAAVEVEWCDEKIYTPETQDNVQAALKETMWSGNKIKRMDMYNTFFDSRVNPADIAVHGEFAGYVELVSRIDLKQYLYSLPGVSEAKKKEALESGAGMQGYDQFYIPQINPMALLDANPRATTDWFSWAGVDVQNKIKYNNMYEKAVMYCRIIPSELGLDVPAPNTVQIWKFVVINGSVVVYAERQTNAHNMLPMVFAQPLEDGLGYQTKSFAQNVVNIQDLASAMINATIEGKRRAVMDRLLYDPSRVRKEDINSKNVVARIPVRPSAYGRPLSEAVFPFPYNDQQSIGLMQEAMQFVQFGNVITGGNNVQNGQFQKGNKTLREFETTMQNSNGRYKTMALFLEDQVFSKVKYILKLNILQYQTAGSYYNSPKEQMVEINPVDLRTKAMAFKVSDGLTPQDRLINADEMQTALQVIGSSPEMQLDYDTVGMWTWWLEARGAKEMQQFRRTPEQKQQRIAEMQAITDAKTPTEKPDDGAPNPAAQAVPA